MNIREMISQMQTGMPSQAPAPVQSAAATSVAKAKAPKKKHKNPVALLAKAHKAAKAGQHGVAKGHALAAANALHKMTPAPAAEPDADDTL